MLKHSRKMIAVILIGTMTWCFQAKSETDQKVGTLNGGSSLFYQDGPNSSTPSFMPQQPISTTKLRFRRAGIGLVIAGTVLVTTTIVLTSLHFTASQRWTKPFPEFQCDYFGAPAPCGENRLGIAAIPIGIVGLGALGTGIGFMIRY